MRLNACSECIRAHHSLIQDTLIGGSSIFKKFSIIFPTFSSFHSSLKSSLHLISSKHRNISIHILQFPSSASISWQSASLLKLIVTHSLLPKQNSLNIKHQLSRDKSQEAMCAVTSFKHNSPCCVKPVASHSFGSKKTRLRLLSSIRVKSSSIQRSL